MTNFLITTDEHRHFCAVGPFEFCIIVDWHAMNLKLNFGHTFPQSLFHVDAEMTAFTDIKSQINGHVRQKKNRQWPDY